MLFLAAIPSCAPRHAAELIFLSHRFDLASDIPYGDKARQQLDVYRPRGRRTPAPVIVFLYGGWWQAGTKRDYRLLGDALTRRGLVVVVPDYRLYPEVRFPAWVQDAAGAVRWARDNIGRYGGDPAQIFVVGHSSGAHTAALLALDERYLREAGVLPAEIEGFVSLAGPVATVWTDPDVQALMGPREEWPATYPIEHVYGSERPILLLHGARDRVVPAANSVRLAARISERGGCAAAIVYRNLDHIGIVLALMLPILAIAPILDEVTSFVRHPGRACGM